MSLSRTERFKLINHTADIINDPEEDWDLTRLNLLLATFDLEKVSTDLDGPTFDDIIVQVTDEDLLEIFSLITELDEDETQEIAQTTEPGNWKPEYVRLFISHSEQHQELVEQVAERLAVVGIHAFVAQDTMKVAKPWQSQIEQALRSMQAFVAFVHPEFNKSNWCQQEVGWAFGRRTPTYALRFDQKPHGFLGSTQWHTGANLSPEEIALLITTWIVELPGLGEQMTAGLFKSLETVGNYVDAGAAAERVAALGNLPHDNWVRLDEIYWSNNQLYTGVLVDKALRPFYAKNSRAFPPAKPDSFPHR